MAVDGAQCLRGWWAEVLNLPAEQIALNTSWRSLGGDSVRAMRLAAVARRNGFNLSVRAILSRTDLRTMAAAMEPLAQPENSLPPGSPSQLVVSSVNLPSDSRREAAVKCQVEATEVEAVYAATPMQESMMASTVQDHQAYVSRQIWRLPPDVDIFRFKAAVTTVVEATPVLRTRLIASQSNLLQVVLRHEMRWETSSEIDTYLEIDRGRSYILGRPLMHAAITEDAGIYRFVWSLHHALYDAWSMSLYIQAVLDVYDNDTIVKGAPFASYVEHLTASDTAERRSFWQEYLENAPVPSFPATEYAQTSKPQYGTLRFSFEISEQHRHPVSVRLQAAWGLLMARHSDTDDIVFGVTLSGRTLPITRIETIAGPTFNTMPLRIKVPANQTAGGFLDSAQDSIDNVSDHQTVSFSVLRGLHAGGRNASDLRSLFIVQPPTDAIMEGHIARVFGVEEDDVTSTMDTLPITAECSMSEHGVTLQLRYVCASLDELTVSRLGKQFVKLVHELSVAESSRPVSQISMTSEADLATIYDWNAAVPAKLDTCIHTMIERVSIASSEQPAVHAWDGNASYSELWEMSGTVASLAYQSGIVKGSCVATLFDKSLYAVVAIVAILRIGATFVPFDPSHPVDRLRTMARSVGTAFALCSPQHSKLCGSFMDQFITVDALSCATDTHGTRSTFPMASSDDDAYIIHTSGSTGKPKAIPITHAQYCSGAYERRKGMFVVDQPRNLAFAGYAFDTSIEDILSSLMFGACICIPSELMRLHVPALVSFINEARVNIADLTPSFVRLLKPEDVPHLKVLFVGGEPMTGELVDIWGPRLHLINAYGPSECSVTSVVNWHCNTRSQARNIGCGTNVRTWLVSPDDTEQLTAIGAVGELWIEGKKVDPLRTKHSAINFCIKGPGVFRGYLNDPEKTAKAIVAPPEWRKYLDGPIHRMYRTGDLCRYNPSGSLIYMGRNDLQTKINSQRIQLEEVQGAFKAALPTTVSVDVDAINIGRAQAKTLCVFLAPSNQDVGLCHVGGLLLDDQAKLAEISKSLIGIRDRLAHSLPRYMIPTHVVCLKRIPLTPSGKLDRRTLQSTHAAAEALQSFSDVETSEAVKRSPTTAAELKMQELWAATLNIEQRSIFLDDTFVACGGDSIAAMRLSAHAHSVGLKLTVSDVFRHSTLSAMSAVAKPLEVTQSVESSTMPFELIDQSILPFVRSKLDLTRDLNRLRVVDCFPATPFQDQMMRRSLEQPGAAVVRFIYPLSQPNFDLRRFRQAWQEAHAANDMLRTRFIEVRARFYQVIVHDTPLWTETTNLEDFLLEDRMMPLGPCGRLHREAVIFDSDGKPQFFVFTAHHAVYDGWSLERLMSEVCSRYHGSMPQERPPFSRFVRHVLCQPMEAMLSFWKKDLEYLDSKRINTVERQTVYAADNFAGRDILFRMDRGCSATAATVAQLAWMVTIAQVSRSNDVLLAMTVTGRSAPLPNVHDILAPTAAEIPFGFRLDRQATIRNVLEDVQRKTQTLSDFEHVGVEQLRRLGSAVATKLDETGVPFIIHPPLAPATASEDQLRLLPCRAEPIIAPNVAFQLDCSLHKSGLEASILYDDRAVSKTNVVNLLDLFEQKIELINNHWQHGLITEVF